jgi:hypothetical protein
MSERLTRRRRDELTEIGEEETVVEDGGLEEPL